jgi:acyl-CoA thioester hydrolase
VTRTVESTYRVIYGDTDQMGVVYYANYLRLFERGRTEFLNEVGFDYRALEADGTYVAVVDSYVKYHQPARFNDLVGIETTLSELGRVRMRFDYRITRPGEPAALLATGYTTHACMDANGRPRRVPASVRAGLEHDGG